MNPLFAEDTLRVKRFPISVTTLQFAGSTGLITAGFSKVSKKKISEIGLNYGYLPRNAGGPIHSISLKFTYSPFRLSSSTKTEFTPLQTGFFLCQNFGPKLGLTWSDNYQKDYYWWPRSLRSHIFISTQFSYKINLKKINKISYYFEANTNDLYIMSYFPNRKTLSLYDIIYFGTGIKLGLN